MTSSIKVYLGVAKRVLDGQLTINSVGFDSSYVEKRGIQQSGNRFLGVIELELDEKDFKDVESSS